MLKKSKYILFSEVRLPDSPPLDFGQNIIERVDTNKHLGIVITYSLDWASHINYICLKANRKLHVIYVIVFWTSLLDRLTKTQ